MPGLENLRLHFTDPIEQRRSRGTADRPESVWSGTIEDAARYYLSKLLGSDPRPTFRGLAPAAAAQLVPDLEKERSFEIPWPFNKAREPVRRGAGMGKPSGRKTNLVRFRQTRGNIPIFGSSAVVELDENRNLISEDVTVGDIGPAPAQPGLSAVEVREKLADFLHKQPNETGTEDPSLTYVYDKDQWHLAWFFRKVPAAPPTMNVPDTIAGDLTTNESPRMRPPRFDYLVDAMDGEVLRWYGSAPALKAMSPVGCRGFDEDGVDCKFLGKRVTDPQCAEMHDELLGIVTIDNKMKTCDVHPPAGVAVRCDSGNFGLTNSAAVSAHVNGAKVISFYRAVLGRAGIDNENMLLVSVVNNGGYGGAQEWKQAQWYDKKIWYGQYLDAQGNLKSCARHLDVIAHELTHGVTEHSCGLKYWRESGALDESFADLFGVVISNVSRLGNNSTADQWSWHIGAGLGANGGPLRDLTAPALAHINQFQPTYEDWGGVHALSGVHTKAVYDVFTAKDSTGNLLMGWMEVVFIYYTCLCQLPPEATFSKARAMLIDSAKTFFSVLPQGDQQTRIAAMENAYNQVGIA